MFAENGDLDSWLRTDPEQSRLQCERNQNPKNRRLAQHALWRRRN